MEKKKPVIDQDKNQNFDNLLKEFNLLWEKSPKDFKKFEALREKTTLTSLTTRQAEAIIDRCNNVIKGDYGNSKKGITMKTE